MKAVSVSELKAGLSRYIRVVRRGGEVQILERGVPVARLVGMTPSGADRDRIPRLVRAGVLRQARGDIRAVLASPPIAAPEAAVSEALSANREDRL
jgi:prevent-host-death family protein